MQLAKLELYFFDWVVRENFFADLVTDLLKQTEALLSAEQLDSAKNGCVVDCLRQISRLAGRLQVSLQA